jgi:4-hydroxymandelate oxidase
VLLVEPLRVDDYARLAQSVLPADVWGYVQGGSGVEWTIAENRAAFDRVVLRPRVLVNVDRCDTTTSLLGSRIAAPIGVAPMAYHRLAHPDGELATAEAVSSIGGPFVVSIFATQPLADIAKYTTGPLWLQIYWLRQRDALAGLVRRAEEAGFGAIVLTVDTQKVARRLRDISNGFALPAGVSAVNLDMSVMASAHDADDGSSAIERHSREQFDRTITWADLSWLRELSTLPLLIKGILTAEDARLAVDHGVDGIIVSNHGGRQLDGVASGIGALPEVVDAVDGRLPVLMDGGVRSGTDVFRALALGASTVLIGRPVLWGLAAGGATGAGDVLRMLRDELVECMTLAGRPTVADIDATAVRLGR